MNSEVRGSSRLPARQMLASTLLVALLLSTAVNAEQAISPDVKHLLKVAEAGDLATVEAALPSISDPQLAAVLRGRVLASKLMERQAEVEIAAALESPMQGWLRAAAWEIVAEARFVRGDYDGAADAAKNWHADVVASGGSDSEQANVLRFLAIPVQLGATPHKEFDPLIPLQS